MLNLPKARYNLNKSEPADFIFGGLKHSEGARDGDIYDMVNMAMDDYPSLSVRKARQLLPFATFGEDKAVYGVGSADKLFYCCGAIGNEADAWFYYDGEAKFPVSASEKNFAVINKYVCIFPDKLYFSLWHDEAVNLNAEEITLYTSLEALNEAMETSTDIKDGDVYAVGEAEPYSFFQYNSQGKWVITATTERHAVQTRWIYLMDSWGS